MLNLNVSHAINTCGKFGIITFWPYYCESWNVAFPFSDQSWPSLRRNWSAKYVSRADSELMGNSIRMHPLLWNVGKRCENTENHMGHERKARKRSFQCLRSDSRMCQDCVISWLILILHYHLPYLLQPDETVLTAIELKCSFKACVTQLSLQFVIEQNHSSTV